MGREVAGGVCVADLSVRMCKWCLCLFFFFQAEDGIRDDLVTGVQTCALPIYTVRPSRRMLAVPKSRFTSAGARTSEYIHFGTKASFFVSPGSRIWWENRGQTH